jgi:integral membrane protein
MTPPAGATESSARPPRNQSLAGSLTRYRVLAYATGVFLLLLTLHVVIQALQWQREGIPYSQAEGLGRWIPGGDVWIPAAHGWLYLAYVIASVDLWMRTRLPAGRMLLVVLAGTVPGMSFVAERWVTGKLRPMIAAVVEKPVGSAGDPR